MAYGPWRKVVSVERQGIKWEWCFGHVGAHRNFITLECGHKLSRKGSIPVPERARCRQCDLDEKSKDQFEASREEKELVEKLKGE